MDIQITNEQKKQEVKSKGVLMSAEIALSIERETIVEKLQELENRISILEKSKKVV